MQLIHLTDTKLNTFFLTLRSPYLKRTNSGVNPHGTAFPLLSNHQKTAQICSSASENTLPYLTSPTQENPANRIFRPFCSATYRTLDS